MAPAAMLIAALAWRDVPPLGALLVIYLPNFIWAGVATLPSAIFQKMGTFDAVWPSTSLCA